MARVLGENLELGDVVYIPQMLWGDRKPIVGLVCEGPSSSRIVVTPDDFYEHGDESEDSVWAFIGGEVKASHWFYTTEREAIAESIVKSREAIEELLAGINREESRLNS